MGDLYGRGLQHGRRRAAGHAGDVYGSWDLGLVPREDLANNRPCQPGVCKALGHWALPAGLAIGLC